MYVPQNSRPNLPNYVPCRVGYHLQRNAALDKLYYNTVQEKKARLGLHETDLAYQFPAQNKKSLIMLSSRLSKLSSL